MIKNLSYVQHKHHEQVNLVKEFSRQPSTQATAWVLLALLHQIYPEKWKQSREEGFEECEVWPDNKHIYN
jgi:hypothetical protein